MSSTILFNLKEIYHILCISQRKIEFLKAPQYQLTVRYLEEYVQLITLEMYRITLKKTLHMY